MKFILKYPDLPGLKDSYLRVHEEYGNVHATQCTKSIATQFEWEETKLWRDKGMIAVEYVPVPKHFLQLLNESEDYYVCPVMYDGPKIRVEAQNFRSFIADALQALINEIEMHPDCAREIIEGVSEAVRQIHVEDSDAESIIRFDFPTIPWSEDLFIVTTTRPIRVNLVDLYRKIEAFRAEIKGAETESEGYL